MAVIAEMDVKKDSRNRITLPADAEFEHYHVKAFEDGHLELYPRVLADPLISVRTLEMMDRAMAHIAQGEADDAIDPDALLASLETASPSAR
jgi:hypothetical protein